MRPLIVQAVVVAAFVAALARADARNGGFAVSVQVVDRRSAPALLDAIPVPPRALAFGDGDSDGGRSYAYPDTPGAAAAFFDAEMPRRGYRALARSGDDAAMQHVWEGDRGRVLLRLQRVLGSTPATRIRVTAAAVFPRPDPPRRTTTTHAGAP